MDAAFALHGVTRTYGPASQAFHALRDVDVTIPYEAMTTVVGPSGSGKSTLLSLLGLLDRPTSGTLTVAGQDTTGASDRERGTLRASHLGFVFQAFHLMPHRTVLDNAMLGGVYRGLTRRQRQTEARERLEHVGLGTKSANLAGTLSGGERQRTAIARALVGSPPVLLCDEPTGNLDSVNGKRVVDILTDLAAAGTTVVLVTHDPTIAALGDCRLHVNDGRVSGG
jgi:putative ABC transport system ATP-binding protein